MHIGIDCEARCGKQALSRGDVVAIQSQAVRQDQPPGDAASAWLMTIMILEPAAPRAAQIRVWQACNEAGVLGRDPALVIVAIEGPGLHLSPVQLAVMQS